MTNRLHMKRVRRAQTRPVRGVVLLEALVGILIFTIGVIGLIGVQAAMTKAQTSANFRAEAAQLASDVVGRMWIDTANIDAFTSETNCKLLPSCKEWLDRVKARMPGGVAPTITRTGDRFDIVITWIVPGEKDDGGKHSFRTFTAISV